MTLYINLTNSYMPWILLAVIILLKLIVLIALLYL
jgi:hypothetical protein